MKIVLQTQRLVLREMTADDFDDLRGILQDKDVMYAYEHAFSDDEVRDWLQRQIDRYRNDGFGLWAMTEKQSLRFVGQCGITMQDANGKRVPEIGYLLRKDCWHKGYATEAAVACKRLAFDKLGIDEIYSIIRDNNIPSQKVALRNGMTACGTVIKRYYGMEMPHIVYSVKKHEV